jgi:LacI family transcriptional regulator
MKLGLTVPADVSIAGFDDAPTARLAWPAITTVHQPVAEMGAAAVRLLCDPGYRETPSDARYRQRLRYDIICRESTAER